MVIKVIIKRRIAQGKSKKVFALLNQFRSLAMEQAGYISGETLINYDDPQEILVIGVWHSIQNWLDWKTSKERTANEKWLERYLDGSTQYKTYVLGTMQTKRHKRYLGELTQCKANIFGTMQTM